MEGIRYKEYELHLEPGAKLFVYTDGLSEAQNSEEELFGRNRIVQALNSVKDEPPEGLLLYVTADSVTYIFTAVILWIASRLDGILEDQTHYLERINDPERMEGTR